MDRKTKGSRRKLSFDELEAITEHAKKLNPPMREYSTAGQWQDARDSISDLYASHYPLYVPLNV